MSWLRRIFGGGSEDGAAPRRAHGRDEGPVYGHGDVAWFDASKAHHGDFRHRALRHHTLGVFECEREFGVTLETSGGRTIPVRWIAEQHVTEDLGFVPSVSQWLSGIAAEPWMMRSRRLSKTLERSEVTT